MNTLQKVSICFTLVACSAWPQTSAVSVVSSATFQPSVAPGSLISIFGSGMATASTSAQLDADGQLPRQLAGTVVQINGSAAPLLYVSAGQINALLPDSTSPGQATVSVSLGGATIGAGSFSVSPTAPGIFTLDSKGTGAIVNAVTGSLSPFSVVTPQSSGSDNPTYLAVFGTGFRYAGNSAHNPDDSNAAATTAAAIDSTGKAWNLTVAYAGAAPGFFGLDQMNLVLPPQMDGLGVVSLTIRAGSAVSNGVTLTIRSMNPPQVTSIAPAAAPPGSTITISGAGLVAEQTLNSAPRNIVVFQLPNGIAVPVQPLTETGNTLTTLVPPMTTGNSTTWYQGPVTVCVLTDGQNACAPSPLTVTAPAAPSLPPGQTLLTTGQQMLTDAARVLNASGDAMDAQAIQSLGQSQLTALQSMIASALAGQPQSFTFTDLNGQTRTAVFDQAALTAVESLLAAGAIPPLTPITESQASARLLRLDEGANGSSCSLPGESALQNVKRNYENLENNFKQAEQAFTMSAVVPTITTCVAAGIGAAVATGGSAAIPACLAAANTTWIALQAFLAPAKFLVFTSTLGAKLSIEAKPNFLSSVTVLNDSDFEAALSNGGIVTQNDSIGVTPGQASNFHVVGNFLSVPGATLNTEVAKKVAERLIDNALSGFIPEASEAEPAVITSLFEALKGELVSVIQSHIETVAGAILNRIAVSPKTNTVVELGSASISISPTTFDQPNAAIAVACASSPSVATGQQSSIQDTDTATLVANKNNVLYLNPAGDPVDTFGGAVPQTTLSLSDGCTTGSDGTLPVTCFDGNYSGSIVGQGTFQGLSGSATGSISFSVKNGVLTVTGNGSGTGNVTANGSTSFSLNGYALFTGIPVPIACGLEGSFSLAANGASGEGSGSCTFPGGAGSGTWTAQRQ